MANTRRRKKTGLPPGSIIFTGNRQVEKVIIHYLQYDENSLQEEEYDNHTQITFNPSSSNLVDWYDIRGLHDTKLLETLGNIFNVHVLALEDIADIHQRPKFEEYEKGIFIIARAISFDSKSLKIGTEQIAFYFNNDLVLSFQETASDLFLSVRQRIRNAHGKIRKRGTDYLVYALLDSVVDNYYLALDEIEEHIEQLEDRLSISPDNNIKEQIHYLKKELIILRKSIIPLREAINRFSKSDSPLIKETSSIFIRDLYSHIVQVTEITETYRDTLNGLQDLYVSEISFKMNQVMQVLTIITTIFVPLSFLAGLYGMNFDHMPELHYRYGYFVLLGVMLMVFIGSLLFFKRKGWF